jgi:hypothetical protein
MAVIDDTVFSTEKDFSNTPDVNEIPLHQFLGRIQSASHPDWFLIGVEIHHPNSIPNSLPTAFPQFVDKGIYSYFCRLQKTNIKRVCL